MNSHKSHLLAAVALLLGFVAPTHSFAGTIINSAVVSFLPSNTSLCPTSATHPVPKGYQVPLMVANTFYSSSVSTGACGVPVTFSTPFPNTSYAVSCTVETSTSAGVSGFITEPSISSKTATGFVLTVDYFLENYDSNPLQWSAASLPTQYFDCVAVSL